MKNKKMIFWGILTIAWLCVIYSFSLEPADLSEDTSLGLIDWLVENLFPWLRDEVAMLSDAQMLTLHGLVRKIAHFAEYFILGVLSTFTMLQVDFKRCMQSLSALSFCMLAASVDETIQLFVEGRAGMIRDVVLDSFGAAVGVGIVIAGVKLWKKRKKTAM